MELYKIFFLVVYLFILIVGSVSQAVIAILMKWDVSEKELAVLLKEAKKQIRIFAIIAVSIPLLILPVEMFLPKIPLIYFLIILFDEAFLILLMSRIARYFSLRKEIKKRKKQHDKEKFKDSLK
jgi:Na+-transporting methylmalonyl-CoA/oxaloacetate decarboxylase gamma subunit